MMITWQAFLAIELLGNTVRELLVVLSIILASILILKASRDIVVGRLKVLSKKTETEIDDVIIGAIDVVFVWPFYLWMAIYVGARFMTIPDVASKIINYVWIIILVWYVMKAVIVFINYGTSRMAGNNKSVHDKHTSQIMAGLAKAIVWALAIVFILSNFGIDVTSLIAGLGIGGIAIAFALQNVLADIFASVSIFFDKPFKVGDFIVIGSDSGVVKKIGMKTTRIQTLQGQELVVSNKELTESRVNNFEKLKQRRVAFELGITYNSTQDKVEKVPKLIKNVFKGRKNVTFDRAHFKKFGDFALIYEIVYFVDSGDYTKFMDEQQTINFAIKKAFDKAKIEMAFPTQTVYVQKAK